MAAPPWATPFWPRSEQNPLRHLRCQLPRRGELLLPSCKSAKLPLRGSWHRAAMTERVSRPLGEGGCDQREQTEGVRPASRFALELETFPPCQRLPPRGSCQSRQALTEGVPNSHPICKLKMQLFCVLRRFSAILRQCKKLCGFCLTGGCLRVIMNT